MWAAAALLGFIAVAQGAQAQTFFLNPAATFLESSNDAAATPVPIDLLAYGYAPGQRISLLSQGYWYCDGIAGDCPTDDMMALFSGSNTIYANTGADDTNRVPGALGSNAEFPLPPITMLYGNSAYVTDAFAVPTQHGPMPTVVTIPDGARYLFVTAMDIYFQDNLTVPRNPFAVVITPVPEPESYAMMLAGIALLALVRARRRR